MASVALGVLDAFKIVQVFVLKVGVLVYSEVLAISAIVEETEVFVMVASEVLVVALDIG